MARNSEFSPSSFRSSTLASPKLKNTAAAQKTPHPSTLGQGSSLPFPTASCPNKSSAPDPGFIGESARAARTAPPLFSPALGGCRLSDASASMWPVGDARRLPSDPSRPFSQDDGVYDRDWALHLATKRVLREDPVRPMILRPSFKFNPAASFSSLEGVGRGDTNKAERERTQRQRLAYAETGDLKPSAKLSLTVHDDNGYSGRSEFEKREDPQWTPAKSREAGFSRQASPERELTSPREATSAPPATAHEASLPSPAPPVCGDKATSREMVTRMRCRNVLLCYALLDPYHQGYIDVQEACDAIGNIHKQDKDVAEILLVQLQDMIAYVSPRGVIEKQDFLAEILRRVESDLAGTTPYYCLRGSSNPVSNAWQRGRPFTTVKNRSFYQGDYVPKGVQMHLKQADGDVAEFHLRRRGGGGMTLQEDRPFTQAKPRAQGTLEDHIQRGRLRRMQKLKQIKDDILNKEMAECTFHPKTTPLPPITKPFPSRETMRRMIEQQQKAKKRSQVFIEYDPTDTVTHELALPPELTEKEKKSVREGGNDWSLAEQEPERDELFTWVVHAGDPPTKPKAVEVAWRARDLPKVPREAEFVADAQDSTQLRPTDMPQTARLRTPINAHEELPSRPSATPRKPTVEEVPCEQPVQDPVPSEDVVIQAPYLTEREFDSRFDAFVPEAWQTPAEDPGIHVHDNEGDGRLNFNSLPVYYRQSLQQLFRGGAVAKGGRRPTREEREAKLKECMKILEDAC